MLARLWDLFTAALVAVAKFVIAGGIMALVLGAIQANDSVGAGAKLFWVIVATAVGIVLTRPVRSFKTIMPGLDPHKSYLRTAVSGAANFLGSRLGSEAGAASGVASSFAQATAATEQSQSADTSTDAQESLAPLRAPTWNVPATSPPSWTQVPSTTAPTAIDTRRVEARTEALAASTQGAPGDHAQVWPGVVAGGPVRRALPAAPLRLESAPSPENTRDSEARPSPGAEVPIGGSGTVVDAGPVDAAPPPTVEPSEPSWARHPRPGVPVESGSEVIYPTGVIVATDEHPLYRRSEPDSDLAAETYISLPEPELDQDDRESAIVAYQSSAGGRRD